MPFSHHSHSGEFCKHASGTLEEVVREAITQGFRVFGLTEHVPRYRTEDLYPEEKNLSLSDLKNQFEAFLAEAGRLRALYEEQIDLLIGLETEYITSHDLDELGSLLGRVEYVVGSIHHVNGVPIDFDLPTYAKALHNCAPVASEEEAQETFLLAYFDAQYDLIHTIKPEVIGHFDLCRLYTPSLLFTDYPKVQAKIERNIDVAISYGALFEVNTAAFRKGWDTAYPGRDVLGTILQKGGRLTLSDDSHGPKMVGLNYDRATAYLRAMGVSELWYLQRSNMANAAGRQVHPVCLSGADCWDHSFWQQSHPSTS